jgi:hypothetical protein
MNSSHLLIKITPLKVLINRLLIFILSGANNSNKNDFDFILILISL